MRNFRSLRGVAAALLGGAFAVAMSGCGMLSIESWVVIDGAKSSGSVSVNGGAAQALTDLQGGFLGLITDLNMRGLEFLYERGEIARVPPRAAVELLLTGIEGMSFRYYSEGRREDLLALHPVLLSVFLGTLGDPPRPCNS